MTYIRSHISSGGYDFKPHIKQIATNLWTLDFDEDTYLALDIEGIRVLAGLLLDTNAEVNAAEEAA